MVFNDIQQEILKNSNSKNKNQKENYEFYKNNAIKFLKEKGLLVNEANLEIFFSNSYIQKIRTFFKTNQSHNFANGGIIIPKYHKNNIIDYYLNSDKHFIVINTKVTEFLKNKLFFTATIVHELVHHIDFCYYDINEQKFKSDNYLFMLFSEYRAKYYQELYLIENNQFNTLHPPIKECKELLSKKINIDTDTNNILYKTFHGVGYIVAHNNISSSIFTSKNLKKEHKENINSLKKLEPDDKKENLDNLIDFLNELIDKDKIQEINFLEEFINRVSK